jgi:uncharacterized membrane protein YhhN
MALPIAPAGRQRLRTIGERKWHPACPPLKLLAIAARIRPPGSAARSILIVGIALRILGGALEQPKSSDWKLAATSLMADRPSLVAEVGKRQ